jgi:hypothetical protein
MSAEPSAHDPPRPRPVEVPIDTSFERLVGRPASEAERARLHRIRDVLGLRDNDAFWSIVMALEQYDALFRAYPAKLAEATERAMERVHAACATAAQQEVAAVQRALAEKVAETSVALARKRADRGLRIHSVTAALAAVVAFGCLCVHAGYALAASGTPFWVHPGRDSSTASRLLASVLSAPGGWMSFALLLPAAVRGALVGWRLAVDPLCKPLDRWAGGCLVACCGVGLSACIVVLARVG